MLVLPFNDSEACATLIREHADRLAAVIVDPLSTAAGLTLPAPGFLETLRSLTSELGIVLIFDEVVSFRAGSGGAQGTFGVQPDLTCLAKVVAGGTPGGAFGGRADIMALYDPSAGAPAIPQSGTYNGNPIVMAGGPGDAAHHDRLRLPLHPPTRQPSRRRTAAGVRRGGSAGLRGHRRLPVPVLLPAAARRAITGRRRRTTPDASAGSTSGS